MRFPTWVDLKGEDSVPETVHHVVVKVDPFQDSNWRNLSRPIPTDGVHANDRFPTTSQALGKTFFLNAVCMIKIMLNFNWLFYFRIARRESIKKRHVTSN